MQTYLEFEKPIAELEGKIHELRSVGQTEGAVDILTRSRSSSQGGRASGAAL